MSLDLHKLEGNRPAERLMSISDAELDQLEPEIEAFRLKTGMIIDQYGDLKLRSNIGDLIDILESASTQTAAHTSLSNILKRSVQEGFALIFVGD
ncbi:MAG: hypothetical protein CMI09_03140 [Oceanospirillaceae bacterium]|nr:hypothetical protein [Oceanospirillaceae bacterium]